MTTQTAAASVAITAIVACAVLAALGKITLPQDAVDKLMITAVSFLAGWMAPQASFAKGKTE